MLKSPDGTKWWPTHYNTPTSLCASQVAWRAMRRSVPHGCTVDNQVSSTSCETHQSGPLMHSNRMLNGPSDTEYSDRHCSGLTVSNKSIEGQRLFIENHTCPRMVFLHHRPGFFESSFCVTLLVFTVTNIAKHGKTQQNTFTKRNTAKNGSCDNPPSHGNMRRHGPKA